VTRLQLGLAAAAIAAGAVTGLLWPRAARGPAAAPTGHETVVAGDQLEVQLVASPLHAVVGQPIRLVAEVARGREVAAPLRYRWSAPGGALDGLDQAEVVWVTPAVPGRKRVKVMVSGGERRATAQVTVEVRLPSPRQVASLGRFVRDQDRAAEVEAIERISSEQRLAELEEIAARGSTIAELVAAQEALAEMAELLTRLGRYDQAQAVYQRLMANLLPGAPKYAAFQAKAGDVAFLLGDEDGALQAWRAGGDHTSGMSHYFAGEILERRGDRDGALAEYVRAEDGAPWYGDPVYRSALLLLDSGADPDAIAALLVDASPRLDRDRMLARFADDPETAALGELLRATGRLGDLEAQRPMTVTIAEPLGGGG